jgi:hypothetical protein
MKNLKFLIDKLKKENTNKPFLLPPKNDDKITIVMEMDEVLLYTFYPDEHEVLFIISDIYALTFKVFYIIKEIMITI